MEREKVLRLKRKLKDEVEEHATWPDLRNRLGLVLAQEGDFEGAIKEFREATRLNSNYREALFNLGFSLLEVESHREAREIFEEVHMRFPQSVTKGTDILGIALLSWKRGERGEGIQILKEAISTSDEFLPLALSSLYYSMGKEEEARSLLKGMKGLEPFIPRVFERWKENSSHSSTFFLNPGLAQFYRDLAEIYAGDGDFKGAREVAEKGVLVSGQLAEYHHDLGNLYAREGEDEKSIHHYQKAIEIDPNYGKAYSSLAYAYGNLGKRTLAIEEFKKAIAIHPNYPDLHYSLGLLYFDGEEYDLAITEFRQALQYNPNFHSARNSLAFCLFQTGEYEESLKEYGKVVARGVTSADIFIHIGMIHRNWKNLSESQKFFEKACEIEPDYAEAHYHLGEIALERGDREKARMAFSRCLALTEDPELIQKVEIAVQKLNSKIQISNSK